MRRRLWEGSRFFCGAGFSLRGLGRVAPASRRRYKTRSSRLKLALLFVIHVFVVVENVFRNFPTQFLSLRKKSRPPEKQAPSPKANPSGLYGFVFCGFLWTRCIL